MIQNIKKPVSILLSLIMVFSMFIIVPLSASAAVGDVLSEDDYLTFTAEEAGSTVTLNVLFGSDFQYDLNGTGLNEYNPGTTITLNNVGDYVRFCGTGTTFDYDNHVSLTGKVACSGNVMSLRLNGGKVQGLTDYCFNSMFYGCTGLTSAPELPETTLAYSCYNYMFENCENLTKAPELPATNLAKFCYNYMFSGCKSLTELPALPATTLANNCYYYMFYGCSNICISTTQDTTYSVPYRIPTTGEGTSATNALKNMFYKTGGNFTGTPDINTTYYVPAPAPTTQSWTSGDCTVTYDPATTTMTVTGNGAMANYTTYGDTVVPWADFKDSVTSVVISDGVTGIGDASFYNFSNLTSLSIADTVEDIGSQALSNCNSLMTITIPASVTSIGYCAFDSSASSRTVTFVRPASPSALEVDFGAFSEGDAFVYSGNNKYILFDEGKEVDLTDEAYSCYNVNDKSLTWEKDFAVTDTSVNGAVTASVGDDVVTEAEYDSTVLLTVAPVEGYQFKSITASYAKAGVEDLSDLIALMGDAVFDGDENDFPGYTCKVENGKFVIYNGETLVTEVSESNMTKFEDYQGVTFHAWCSDVLWSFTVTDGKITDIVVNDDTSNIFYPPNNAVESTGTLPTVELALTTVTEGSQYSFTMPKNPVTVTAEFEEAPAPTPAKLILNVGENGKVVMDNGTFGNATDASNIAEVHAPINVADGAKVFIVDGHSANLVEGGSINIATGDELSFCPSDDNTGEITAIPDEDYICTGWYNGDTLYYSDAALSYQSISEDMTLTAKFAPAYTVTWKNWDGTVLENDENVAEGATPSYDGATPVRPEDANNTYTFAAWDDGTTTYLIGVDDLPPVTGDVTYTAVYTSAPKLFTGHSVTLGGDIGVNFFLNPAVLDTYTGTKTVKFTCDGKETTVDVPATATDDGYKVTCNVVAAQMAHTITAALYVDGELVYTDEYSVREYAEKVFENPQAYDNKNKPEQLKALAKALLNYGAMAQTVFDSALTDKTPAPANTTVGTNGYSEVTAEQIAAAINGEASDLNEVATQLGAKYYTNSLIYLSKNTLRIYFTPTSYPGEIPNADAYDGNRSGYYYYVDHADIPAAELDDQQTFTVGGTTFTFSALDYAKAVVGSSNMTDTQKNLAKALFLYNQAANAYFDEAVPAQNIVDLSTLTGDYEAQDGDILTGALQGNHQITIAADATVILKDADITCLFDDASFAGITPNGDATILLEGENTVKGGHEFYPGIFVPENTTLTIDGTGSLEASSKGNSCGIGGGVTMPSGNIVINGGNITATGGNRAAGIGGAGSADCGSITINGGIVNATGGNGAAGIGGAGSADCGSITINGGIVNATGGNGAAGIGSAYETPCGSITINGGIVNATGGNGAAGIGSGYSGTCSDIIITGGTITAIGGDYSAGIGSGYFGTCGNITIAATVTQVTATKGCMVNNSIGEGFLGTCCGTISIADPSRVTQN